MLVCLDRFVFNMSTRFLHAACYWDRNAHPTQKVERMCELLQNAMVSPYVGAREWKVTSPLPCPAHCPHGWHAYGLQEDGKKWKGSLPRKIGFSDKDVVKDIHVSLAQINIAVVHEPVQPAEIASVTRVFSYYARCKQHTQSPYHDITGILSLPNVGGCLLYTSPSPRDQRGSRMPSSA